MTTILLPRNGRAKRPGQFRTKTEGMNRRKSVWACAHCREFFYAKRKMCDICGCQAFHYFPSAAESKRFAELALMLDHGMIRNLEVQPEFPIVINGIKVTTYRGDFRYLDKDGRQVTEDVKPAIFRTDVYQLKKKLVESVYAITIREVTP